ncbi:MAG: hypothetical protein HQK66_10800 [Desulfamplus sp.]|nr:hypothetical protein [Desulfamplus sp.]
MLKGDEYQVIPGRLFYRTIARENPRLLGAAMKFNASLHMDALKSSLDNPGLGDFYPFFKTRPFPVSPRGLGFWDFEDESRRLALLDAETLKNLLLTWGTAFCAPFINRYVRRDDLEILERDIGRDLLSYARGRGRFSLGALPGIPRPEGDSPSPESMRSMIIAHAMKAHGICISPWPEKLKSIEIGKIEQYIPELAEYFSHVRDVPPSHLRSIWFSLKKILLKEVAPQWTPCFS